MSPPGQRVPVPVPQPGPEKAAVVGMQPLVPINSAAVSRDGRYIAVGLEDRAVVLWDTAAGRPVRTLAGHQKAVLSVAFSPDGKHLLSGSADATAVLWDVETGAPVRTYKGHTGAVVSVAFSPDGTRLLTGSPDGTAILWDTGTGEPVHTLKSKGILGVAYSPDGDHPGHGVGGPHRDAVGRRDRQAERSCCGATGRTSTASPSARTAAASSPGRPTTSASSGTWPPASASSEPGGTRNNVHSVAFTPDGRRVITGEREELVMMWDAATGAHVRTFVGHSAEILSIVPSPDGRTMLTGSRDGTARLWDLATGRELLALTTDGTRKTWAVVSPDGLFDASEAGPPRARLPLHEAARRRRSISSSPRATAPGCWPRCGGANGRSRRSRWAGASPRSSSSSRRRTAVRPRRPRPSRRTSPTRAAASGASWSRTTASASPSRRRPSPRRTGRRRG